MVENLDETRVKNVYDGANDADSEEVIELIKVMSGRDDAR